MPNKVNFNTMRSVFFFTLIIILGVGTLYIIMPFIYPIFWAAVIAVLFYPLYARIQKWLKLPRVSSMITLTFVVIVIFLPLTLLSILLVNESVELYVQVSNGNYLTSVEGATVWLDNTPLAPYVEKVKTEWTGYATSATKAISIFLFQNVKSLTEVSLKFVFMLFIMFYTLYYFFKDGPNMLKALMRLSPLGDKYEVMLYQKFTSTTRATLKSTFIVGGIQGILGGIMFWIAGIQGALIWGLIMVALSIIPAVGSVIVWLPAAIIMLSLGHIGAGIFILIGGTVISFIDNLLRPPLIGNDIQMHPLIVLFTTLGGLIMFGISGFVIGPIIAALFMAIMSIYNHYYRNELENN
ncbi:AI-2E family transporter [Patescibacteria group bacterium]|nr:AI-2E family transporter [Patescibacteria group bacterium]